MTSGKQAEATELVAAEADGVDYARTAAPHAAATIVTSGSGQASDLEQYAARRAEEHLDAALCALREVLDKPGRNAQVRLMAAKEIIALALRRNQQASGAESDKVYVLDSVKAADSLRRRLGL